MFFEKNKKLLLAAGGVAIIWVVLYYVFVGPNWAEAGTQAETARAGRSYWLAYTDAKKEKDEARKQKRANEFKTKADAEDDLNRGSEQIETKFRELRKIEFGTHETLKAFSTAAAGKSADMGNLVNETVKRTKDRANAILKIKIEGEKLSSRFKDEASSDALNLLRLAMVDRFLSACKEVKDVNTKECKIEELVAVDYYLPAIIPAAKSDKLKDDESVQPDDEAAENTRPKSKKDKNKSAEKVEELDKLVQIPMKVLVRAPERYINQLLYELAQPTGAGKDGEDRRGYFCIKGFHVAVSAKVGSSGEQLVEMCVALSALLRESEVAALGIKVKGDGGKRDADAY